MKAKHLISVFLVVLICVVACAGKNTRTGAQKVDNMPDVSASTGDMPVVYMTTDISPAGLAEIYNALGRKASGKVAVKISTGEPGGKHFLSPDLIKGLVQSVNGTFVESNTAYGGRRASTAMHKMVAIEHGFTAVAPVDIQDEHGEISLPVTKGRHLTENIVGKSFPNYDFYLVLSHFKGHQMGGFGGALKNISIGIASSQGKNWIHTGGTSKASMRGGDQTAFLESMAEASGAVIDHLGENIMYINVMNHLSVDCDCNGNPSRPEMEDIGILGSLDPVALDKACVDLIYAADEITSASLRQRIELRNGTHLLDHAQALGYGSQQYQLKMIDG